MPALDWAGEHVLEKNADIKAAVDEFWQEKSQAHDGEYACSPRDMYEIFEIVNNMRDPRHQSGVGAIFDEDATLLS